MRSFLLFPAALFLILFATSSGYAAPNTEPQFKIVAPYGLLVVETQKEGEWQEVKRLGYTHVYREKVIDLQGFLPKGAPAVIRLRRDGGGGHAHLEAIDIGGAPPVAMAGKGDLFLAQKKDNDVLPLGAVTRFTFPAKREGDILKVTARIEPETIPTTPFLYPPENMRPATERPGNLGEKVSDFKEFYTYRVGSAPGAFSIDKGPGQVDSLAPFMKVDTTPGSGHPSGPTYTWVSDDGEKLYVALEFTADNTRDGDVDYAKVFAVGSGKEKIYTITEKETTWGKVHFGSSRRAGYRHKYYQFAIPLEDMGAKSGERLKLAFAAYGTAGLLTPVEGDTFDLGSVQVGKTATLAVTYDSGGSNSTMSLSVTGANAGMFSVTKGTCPSLPIVYVWPTMTVCDVDFHFTPTATGAKSAQVVADIGTIIWPFPVTVNVLGTGIPGPIKITVDVDDGQGGKTQKSLTLTPTP